MVRALRIFRRDKPIEIDAKKPELAFRFATGQVQHWSYDVVQLKLRMDAINECRTPDAEHLRQFADYLAELGCPFASVDVAFRIWSLVTVQFQQIAKSIAAQVKNVG